MAILLKDQLKQLLEGVHYHAPFINVIKKGKEDPETLKNSTQIFYDFYAMEMMHSLFSEPEDPDRYKAHYIDGITLTPAQRRKAQAVYNMGGGLALLGTHIDNIMLLPKGIQVVPQAFRNIVDNVYQEVVIQTAKKILAHLRLTLISEFRHLIDKADSWARFRRKLISIYNKKGIITQDDFENAIQTYIPGMAKHTDSIKRLLFFCKYYDEMYPDPADLISKSPEVGGIPGLKSKKRREPGEEPEFSPELDKPIDADGEKETEPSPELDKPIDTDGESDDVDIDEPMTKVPSGAEMDTSPYKYQKEIDLLKLKQYFDKLKKDKNKKKLQEAKYDASYAAGKIHPGTVLIIKKAIQKSGLKWEDILLAYKHIDWNASFGGPRWGEGVDAYLRLDANTRKHNFKEMVSDIDHIYDLEHNTGAFLNKGGMYVKTKDLDRRAKITRLSQFIPDVSPIIKQIIIRALKYSTKYPEIEQDIYGPHKMEYIPFTSEEEEVLKSFGFTRTVDNNIWNVGTSYRDKNGKRVLNPIAIKHLANGKYVIYDLINTELEIFETWDEFKTWFKENSKRFERGGYASGLVAKTQKGSNPSSTSKSPVTTKPPGIVTHQVWFPLSSEESEQLEKLDNKKDNIGFKIDSKGISKFGTFLFGNFYTTLIVCKIHPTHNTEKYYVVHYSDVGINTWEFSTWSQTLMFVKSNFSKLTKYKELDIDALNIPSPTLDLKAESLPPHSPSKATYKAHIGIDKPPIHTIRLTAEDEQYLFIYGFHPKMEGENIYYLHEVIQDKIKFYPNNTALISFSSMHPSNNTIKKSIEDTLAWIKLGYQPINQSKVKPEEKPEIKPEINPEEKPKIKYTNGFKLSSMYENMLSQKGFNWSPSSTMYINSSNGDAIYVQQNLKSIYSDGETGETSLFNSLPELAVFLKKYDELKTNLPTSLDSSHLPTSLDSSHYPSASLDKLTASTDIGTPIKLLDQDHEIVLNEGFEFNSKDFTYRNLKTRDEFKIYDSGYVRYKIKGVGEGINNIKFIFNILQHKYGIFEKGHGSFSIIQRLEEEGYKSNKHSYESKNLYFEKFLDKAGSIKLKAVVVVQSNYRTSYFLCDVTSVETIIGHRHFKHIKDMYPLIGMEESILMYISTALEKELKDEGYNINHKLPSYVYSFSNDKFVKFIKFKGNGSATFALVEFKSNGKEEFKEKINFQNYYEAITWIKQPTMDAGLSKTDKKHNINVSMEDISDIKDNFKKEFSYYDYGGWAKNTSHSPDSTIRLINKDESLMKKIGFSLNKDENNVYYYFNKEDIKVFFFVDGHAEIIRNNGELTNFPTIEKAIFNLWEQFYIKKKKEDAELLPIIDNFNVRLPESKEQILKSLGFNLVEKDGSIYYVNSNWEITFYRNGYTSIRDLKTGKIINSFYTHDEAIDYLKNNLK